MYLLLLSKRGALGLVCIERKGFDSRAIIESEVRSALDA